MRRADLFFELLANKFNPTKKQGIFSLVPEKQRLSPSAVLNEQEAKKALPLGTLWLEHIHYSHLIEPLSNTPKQLRPFILASLPDAQKEALQKIEKMTKEEIPTLSPLAKTFFLKFLWREWKKKDEEALPYTLLQETPLSSLLSLTKRELIELVDLIAMHDLVEELRAIVDKKLILSICQNLSPNQQKYLKVCLHQKTKAISISLNIKELYKNKALFLKTLHKRGLKRLAIALSGQMEDFVFHLAHIFDSGRGQILLSNWQKEEIPLATQTAQAQVAHIVQILQHKATS
jgi:hypothetical protein